MLVVDPESLFEEGDLGLVEGGVVDSEPAGFVGGGLVDNLEEGAPLEELVADAALDLAQDLEELEVVDVGRPCQLLEGVGECRLEADQGLYGDLVDLLEGGPEDVGKVLGLELVDEGLVGVLQVHLPHDAVLVDLETALGQFPGQQVLDLVLIDLPLLGQFLQDQGLLGVALGGHVEDEVQGEDVELEGFLLAELLVADVVGL